MGTCIKIFFILCSVLSPSHRVFGGIWYFVKTMNSYGNIISYRYIYLIFIYINLNFLRLDYVGQTLQFSFGVLKLVSKFHIIPQTDKEKSVKN